MTTTERANDVIENVMKRLKACNAKDPKLFSFRMLTKNNITSASATISVSAVGTTNPKYREDICDIIRFAIKGEDVFGAIVRLKSESDGIIMIGIDYNISKDRYRNPDVSRHVPSYIDDKLIFSNEDLYVRTMLRKLGIESVIKTGSNTDNARTGTNMRSCVFELTLPDTFSKTMIRHISKIIREEMYLKYKNKHINTNILDLHDNIYLYVSVVTKTK